MTFDCDRSIKVATLIFHYVYDYHARQLLLCYITLNALPSTKLIIKLKYKA